MKLRHVAAGGIGLAAGSVPLMAAFAPAAGAVTLPALPDTPREAVAAVAERTPLRAPALPAPNLNAKEAGRFRVYL